MPSFDLTVLIPLLAAHLLSDFTFQTDSFVRRKNRPAFLLLHVLITTATAYLLLGDFTEWRIPLVILATHGLIDLLKLQLSPKPFPELPAFIGDQVLHLLVILAISAIDWTGSDILEPWWLHQNPIAYLKTLVVIAALVTTTKASGLLIAIALPRMLSVDPTELNANTGLNGAGRYIGYLERILLLIFVFSNQLGAAGFLIAAKSVLRFQKANESRRDTEYILLGTLLSFTMGIASAFLFRLLLP